MDMLRNGNIRSESERALSVKPPFRGRTSLVASLALATAFLLAGCGTSGNWGGASLIEPNSILVSHDAEMSTVEPSAGSPLEGSVVAGIIEVYLQDPTNISEVWYELDDTRQPAIVQEAPFVLTLDTTSLTTGAHTLLAQPRMLDGLPQEAAVVEFFVNSGGHPTNSEPTTNTAPAINLLEAVTGSMDAGLTLSVGVYDDGLPAGELSVTWSKDDGPGAVLFSDADSAKTLVMFSEPGQYVLRLDASDGELTSDRSVAVLVTESGGTLPPPPDEPGDPLDGEFDGPIRITKGGVYSGRWASDDPNVPAVYIDTSERVVLENSILKGPGNLITTNFHKTAHLTVRNSRGYGVNPNIFGRAPGRFLAIQSFADLVIENNYLENTAGIYAHRWVGGGTIKIRFNRIRNVVGLWSDGEGSWLTGAKQFSIAQFVQFNDVNSISGAEIAWNEVINTAGQSRVEDVISMYKSSGTSSSPIAIHDNFIMGAYPALPSEHPFSGGAIMLGDGGGGNQSAFRNQVVSVTNYGIAISGGSNNAIEDNRVISSGALLDGTLMSAANVGIYIWNQASAPFSNNSGTGNLVGYLRNGVNGPVRNDWWVPDAASWQGNTRFSGPISTATELSEYELWVAKHSDASVHIGVLD